MPYTKSHASSHGSVDALVPSVHRSEIVNGRWRATGFVGIGLIVFLIGRAAVAAPPVKPPSWFFQVEDHNQKKNWGWTVLTFGLVIIAADRIGHWMQRGRRRPIMILYSAVAGAGLAGLAVAGWLWASSALDIAPPSAYLHAAILVAIAAIAAGRGGSHDASN